MAVCYRHPDRETGLACSECGRPICTDCMTMAPVGLRCPDHAGRAAGVQRVGTGVGRTARGTGVVTKTILAVNVAVFLVQLAQGGRLGGVAGSLFERGALVMRGQLPNGQLIGLAEGEWWRLLTAAFLHQGIVHLLMNMLALWWFGRALEDALGPGRYILLYVVSGLAGSAGALLLSPDAVTVGASGAIFGLLGAALVLERQQIYIFGGSALGIVVLNLAFTLFVPNISLGGHLGGLVGGALGMLALSRLGRTHALYGRAGALGIVGLVAVGLLSVAVAYVQVGRYA
ncbi:MAG: rhomboid family intramembrane serine protease [Actinomycetota bacterium]|nr:rhomboid family intramembrane serine protease [Actinomycetota bacterium]